MAFTHGWHQAVLEDFAEALRTGRAPAITGADGLAAHRLIDAITRSAAGGTPVAMAAGAAP
jgi:predicted dehydrogenase